MSFAIYLIGYAFVLAGLIYAAVVMHLAAHWIAILAMIVLGVGITHGVAATRSKDPA